VSAIILSLSALGVARAAGAQRTTTTPAAAPTSDAGSFILRHGADTVAVENFERSANQLRGVLVTRGAVRYEYTATLTPDQLVSRLDLSAFAPAGHEPIAHMVLSFTGDSVIADMGAGNVKRIAVQHGIEPWLNPSFAFAELLVRRARVLGGASVAIPLYAIGVGPAQDVTVMKLAGDSVAINFPGAAFHVRVDARGRLVGGVLPAQSLTVHRADKRVELVKPDYSAPPGAPYTAEEVSVAASGGFALGGTLTLPKNRTGRVPAVVTITGSGLEDRDEAIAGVRGYRPFRQLADTLGRIGVAVLRLDDRGYGASRGDQSRATSADFADDIRSALTYLRQRPEIDPSRLFLVGHSEGGAIAPLVASTDTTLRGIVLLAGPARNGMDILKSQIRYQIGRDSSISPARRDSLIAAQEALIQTTADKQPWMRYFITHDPLATARTVSTPVLLLQGTTDRQITPDQVNLLANAFREGGNTDVTVRTFPGLDHLFLADPSGNPAAYGELPSKTVGKNVLGTIADWIAKRASTTTSTR
jgi:alpha-beta hydrolase superfamily lysophospholipase